MTDLGPLLQIAGAALEQVLPYLAVEDRVRGFLQKETPEIGFLGEERGGTGIDDPHTWALDPVDGAANLVNGLPLYAISLGLGAIDLPFMQHRFRAAEGHGAYADDEPIQASRTTALNEAIVAIGDYAVGVRAQERNVRRLALTGLLAEQVLRVRMFGSAAIDLVWVASGELDASIAHQLVMCGPVIAAGVPPVPPQPPWSWPS